MRKTLLISVVVALVSSMLWVAPAHAASCAGGIEAGGDWPSYGQDLSNARNQQGEHLIDVGTAASLEGIWSFTSAGLGGYGAVQSTPAVADGCVFVTSAALGLAGGSPIGAVSALDARTGELVWQVRLPVVSTITSGIFAPAVADGRVFALVGQQIPYVVALDQATGELLWITPFVDRSSLGINSGAVTFDGLIFVATVGGGTFIPAARPSFFLLDAETGEVLKQTQVIPEEEAAMFGAGGIEGYSGGGIWTTAAVDAETKHLYAGTANPYSNQEHERTNAILKIDVDRASATFGEIVGSYKGDPDSHPDDLDTFECQTFGDLQVVGWNVPCQQRDLDFGASPNLFTHADGRTVVGALQKSGNYHAVYADTMELAWKAELTPPSMGGNSATAAVDATTIYVAANLGLYALDRDTGAIRWHASQGASGYRSVSMANGVIYITGADGGLDAFDATTGDRVASHRIGVGSTDCLGASPTALGGSSSAAVAYHTVYAACDLASDLAGGVFAYRLPEGAP